MKWLFVAACLLAVLGAVISETCTGDDASTCSRANCLNMYPMACLSGECHCFASSCFVGQVLCDNDKPENSCDHLASLFSHCNCHHNHSWHCLHGRCHCGGKTN